MSLASVKTFRVPQRLLGESEAPLRESGAKGCERFVLWTGNVVGAVFVMQTVIVPAQSSYKLDDGLCVRVDGGELHRINLWLHDNRETLGVQIHTHPTDAYHSNTDDSYPIATQLGSLSIVVPDFCRRGLFTDGTVAYRLTSDGWIEEPDVIANGLVEVVGQ